MNRIGLKLACLIASLVIWIQVAYNTNEFEDTVGLPLELVNLPADLTVAGFSVEGGDGSHVVPVRLRGSKLLLLAHHYLGLAAAHLKVDLAKVRAGDQIQRPVLAVDVETDLEVRAIMQSVRLRLHVDDQDTSRVPVRVQTVGELPAERVLLKLPTAAPDSVLLSGPARFLAAVERIQTETVDLARFRKSDTIVRKVISPSPHLVLLEEEVAVTVAVAPLELRTLAQVPIVPLVDADQAEVTVFPPVADLVISGPADSVQALTQADVAVTVPLTGLADGTHRLRGQVILPEGFVLVSLEPEVFLAIIGEIDPEGQGQRQ